MNHNRVRQIFVFVMTLLSQSAFSQATEKSIRHREQLWFGYFNQTRLTNKLGIWFDVHYRQTDNFIDRPFQFVIRPGLTYYIKDNLRVHAGYAFFEHFPAKGFNTARPEHRTWQQIWWNQKSPGLTILHRLRFEQRFNRKIADDVLLDDYNFNYRLRHSMSFIIPLNGKEIAARKPFATIINEVFLNFGDPIIYNTFDQNRFFAGIGYQFTTVLNAQLGYMHVYQQEASGDSYISTNVIRLFFFHSLDLRKNEAPPK